ncbi:Cellobiose phosphorylase [subsurface metagenome]
MLEYLGNKQEAITIQEKANRMEENILSHGWDGEWFLRAYDAFSHPIGSIQCEEGQIFIEPQGICSMADIGLNSGHVTKALNAVHRRLATPHGIMLIQPPYSQYQLRLGEISSYPPGYKENGSIFCHSNPWIMIAETKNRNGDRAYDYYMRINPSARENLSKLHTCEPYIYAQTIAGQDAPTFGEAKNSWLTGAATWNYIAITQWILGIRPCFDGLLIDPVIPNTWSRFKVTRVFRGKNYEITVQRSANIDALKIVVNGKNIEGNFIPVNLETSNPIQVLVFIP